MSVVDPETRPSASPTLEEEAMIAEEQAAVDRDVCAAVPNAESADRVCWEAHRT